ncbi:hypothetical protein INR49_029519 [Caranx melampygus]|nr:hypothetical protein INR49_029519 [Caranx melampygus]
MDVGPPPPPPPPLLLLSGNQAQNTRPAPQPGFAAIPFNKCAPTQETHPPPEALPDAQDEENPPLLQVEDEPLSMATDWQEHSASNEEEEKDPVQETNPAPQVLHDAPITEEQDEAAAHMEPASDDQQA